MFIKHYAPTRCEPSIEVIVKLGVRPGEGLLGSKVGGRGWCVINAKKGGRVRFGDQGGCEPRIEVSKLGA